MGDSDSLLHRQWQDPLTGEENVTFEKEQVWNTLLGLKGLMVLENADSTCVQIL